MHSINVVNCGQLSTQAGLECTGVSTLVNLVYSQRDLFIYLFIYSCKTKDAAFHLNRLLIVSMN